MPGLCKFLGEECGRTSLALTDSFIHQLKKSPFGSFPELFILTGFLAHHKPATAVAGVKPLRRWRRLTCRAVEPYPSSHLHERTALRKLCRSLVLHSYQCTALVIFQQPYRTDRYLVARSGLANTAPVPCGENQADHEYGRKHNCRQNEEGFFQSALRYKQFCSPLLWAIGQILSTRPPARRALRARRAIVGPGASIRYPYGNATFHDH